MFHVRRKILRSYLVTSSSNADTSPLLAAATKAGSSSRTTDGRFAFGAFTGIRSLPADIASKTRKYHELTPVVLLPPSLENSMWQQPERFRNVNPRFHQQDWRKCQTRNTSATVHAWAM